ncbi:anti-sigma-F factor Fin family protein [Paenalkalicoccus suaedae]|uniref:Anti-sigma-F factor Fin family protein n=1 Tax=Paenalkalicoccus suaedae TaxID=2592382 RepID=A0A859F988_9BACI|nr:anti-sigma-F factor Fin [Paenalkalicoccus suaedae]QKS69643.1 anti-sigma-F factor Fin family protein [Paenalkalicoccus suaedae]
MVHYYCRHCKQKLGKVDHHHEHESSRLGFHLLSEQDKQTMLHYDSRGDVHVQSICEHCEDVLFEHPNYHEYESFLH